MNTRLTVAIAALLGLGVLMATGGQIVSQEATPEAAEAAMGDEAAMMPMATPAAMDAEMAEQMQRMMEQCTAMMEMMMGMMGGEGMEGMEGMADMEGMPAASPTPGA